MDNAILLNTPRLILRQWQEEDLPAFAALNSDVEVMRFFPALLSREESDALANRIRSYISTQGWGFWALELKENGKFIGFTGLHRTHYDLPFTPCVEIGWRLAKPFWGWGLASEAALEALRFGFQELDLNEIVSFTALQNQRSRAVMERIHMIEDPQRFLHPLVAAESGLQEHCLYRLSRERWLQRPC